ncbi:MAG TPA: hypothetical protein VFC44_11330 [Candidatus Saccharimonadales bacterium]|nr:hypothetical protein [Candidatus Saccharimonadales bacterium]
MVGLAAGCAAALALPTLATAQVSNDDFNALKKTVEQLAGKVQKLEQTHAADQQTHQKDQAQIEQLRQKLGETQTTAIDAEKKADAVAQVQPVYRVPTDSGSVNRNFMILGDAEFQYAKSDEQHGAFMLADFAPIFLYRAGDNILFEAGFDFILQNNAPAASGYTTTVNLSFAQLNYLVNDYVTFAAGSMLLPLGTYSQRSAGWLNEFPDDPLPRDLLPGAGVGAQLLGSVPFGASGQMLTYSVFGVNGPSSADGTGNAGSLDLGGNVGLRSDNAVANLHGEPSGGGRLGWFIPYKPHYDLELGISGESGEWDNAGSHRWSAGVVDASLHLGSFFEAKGEYIRTCYGSDDLGQIRPRGWWTQVGYKLAGLNLNFPGVNNLELVGRYDTSNDGLGTKTTRYSVGYIYYLTNALLFEGDYEFRHGNDLALQGNQLVFQLGYGF